MSDPCGSTQHCAYHGWCHRCDPRFSALMSEINLIIQRGTEDEQTWGPLYAQIAKTLHGKGEAAMAAELAEARETNRRLNRRSQASDSRLATVERAVGDWKMDEGRTQVPLHTLTTIAKAAGKTFDDRYYVLHYQHVAELEATVGRLRQLLKRWCALGGPALGVSVYRWWDQRLKEFIEALEKVGVSGGNDE